MSLSFKKAIFLLIGSFILALYLIDQGIVFDSEPQPILETKNDSKISSTLILESQPISESKNDSKKSPKLILEPQPILESKNDSKKSPTLILYTTVDEQEKLYRRDNLRFFLRKGYLQEPNYQFIVIINGCHKLNLDEYKRFPNFHVLVRKNLCYDAGGWLDGLDYMHGLGFKFQKYIFLNCSVRGPFVPNYISKNDFDWVSLFTSRLNDELKLVGTSINCLNLIGSKSGLADTHIQSMAFATDSIGLECCIYKTLKFPQCNEHWQKKDVIWRREVQYSKSILKMGYSIGGFLEGFKEDISLKSRNETMRACESVTATKSDIYYPHSYGSRGISIDPFEIMFIKTNRKISPKEIETYSEWNYPNFFSKEERGSILMEGGPVCE